MCKNRFRKLRHIFPSLLCLMMVAFVLWLVFHENYREILQNMRSVHPRDMTVLLLMSEGYQLFDALICKILVGRKLARLTFSQAFEITQLGVFGNVATLSVGSLPLQGAYLQHQGMAAGEGIGILNIEYVLHKISVLVCCTLLLSLGGKDVLWSRPDLLPYILFGYGVCVVIILALVLLCTWGKLYHLASHWISRLSACKTWEARACAVQKQLDALYMGAADLLQDPKTIVMVTALDLIKLLGLYTIPFMCLRTIDVSGMTLLSAQMMAALAHVISNAIPNVAGLGPYEVAFLLIFSKYMGAAETSSALILYRVSTYFAPFLVSTVTFQIIQCRAHRAVSKWRD